MSYIRANEFVLQNETVQFVYAHAHELGYTDDQTEELLAAFDRDFLRKLQSLAATTARYRKLSEGLSRT